MEKTTCPRCGKEMTEAPQYQCCRCFTIYCNQCEDTNQGRSCPKCKMGARLILSSPNSKKASG